ncbi:MAG: hypothetical protein V4543_13375 [Bacteroidota bacterium]
MRLNVTGMRMKTVFIRRVLGIPGLLILMIMCVLNTANAQSLSSEEAIAVLAKGNQSTSVLEAAAVLKPDLQEVLQANTLHADSIPDRLIIYTLENHVQLEPADISALKGFVKQGLPESVLIKLLSAKKHFGDVGNTAEGAGQTAYVKQVYEPRKDCISLTIGAALFPERLNRHDQQNFNTPYPSTADAGAGLAIGIDWQHPLGQYTNFLMRGSYALPGYEESGTRALTEKALLQAKTGGHYKLETYPWMQYQTSLGVSSSYTQKGWQAEAYILGGFNYLAAPSYKLEAFEAETSAAAIYMYDRKSAVSLAPSLNLGMNLTFYLQEHLSAHLRFDYGLSSPKVSVDVHELKQSDTGPVESDLSYSYRQAINVITIGAGMGFRF